MTKNRHDRIRANSSFGRALIGFGLIAAGLLLFLTSYLEIPWSELWPLLLVIPGLVIVTAGRRNYGTRSRRHDHSDDSEHSHAI